MSEGRSRLPSTPGIPGQRLPPPDSLPPEERVLKELANTEGRMLAQVSDLGELVELVQEEARAERRELREHVARIEQQVDAQTSALQHLTTAVLQGRDTDVELTRDVGKLRTQIVAAGRSAGGKRGIVAAIATVLSALGAKWLAQKLGIEI